RPGKAFNRGDGAAFDLSREGQAGQHALAVDMDGAGAALALIAALLGAGQRKVLAQGIEQRDARLDGERPRLSIDHEVHAGSVAHQRFHAPTACEGPGSGPWARLASCVSPGRASGPLWLLNGRGGKAIYCREGDCAGIDVAYLVPVIV